MIRHCGLGVVEKNVEAEGFDGANIVGGLALSSFTDCGVRTRTVRTLKAADVFLHDQPDR